MPFFNTTCCRTASSEIILSTGQKSSIITDNLPSTKIAFPNGGQIEIHAPQNIAGVYIVWDKPPGKWSADIGKMRCDYGDFDFIHEYIETGVNTKELTLNIPPKAILCDIRIFASGELPPDIEVWQPPLKQADMLLLPTHADDEHLYFGGTMPYYAGELGLKLQVVYLTNHWNDPRRPHELLKGLWTVGITAYPIIGPFADLTAPTFSLEGAKLTYNTEEWIEFQVQMIRRFKPSVIIGHDINGEYGHGAHMLNTNTLMSALNLSALPEEYPDSADEYGVWDVPKTYLHLFAENKIRMNWDIPLDNFSGKTAFQMAEAGYACHKSQHIFPLSVGRSGVSDCQAFGLYRTTVGLDTNKDDFFENISSFVDFTADIFDEQAYSSDTLPDTNTDTPSDTSAPETETPTETDKSTTTPENTNNTGSTGKTDSKNNLPLPDTIDPISVLLILIFFFAAVVIIIILLRNKNRRKSRGDYP